MAERHISDEVIEQIGEIVEQVLVNDLGLVAPIEYRLTHKDGRPVLFCVMDATRLGTNIGRYQTVTHQLSTALGGIPVEISNTSGLRYALFLDGIPELPQTVEFPDFELGKILLGVNRAGKEVSLPIGDFGHFLISGMTRYGKSSFVRSLIVQLARNGGRFIFIDEQNVTVPQMRYLACTELFEREVANIGSVLDVIEAEYTRRIKLFDQLETRGVFVETLAQYNKQLLAGSVQNVELRYYIMIEEYNDVFSSLDNATRARLVNLVRKAGKYGIHFILVAQDWTKDQVGPIRGQLANVITFRLDRPSQSRAVLGVSGADKLRFPGRALTNNWGEMQTYYMSKEVAERALSVLPQNTRSTGSIVRTSVPEPVQSEVEPAVKPVQNTNSTRPVPGTASPELSLHSFDDDPTRIRIMLYWGFAASRIAKVLGGNYQNRLQQIKAIARELEIA